MLKRLFIRAWVAPFYVLVTFPYVVLISSFGDGGEKLLNMVVNFFAGNLGSAETINAADIIRATAVIFVIINVVTELALKMTGRSRTGISYSTDIAVRAVVCAAGWFFAAGTIYFQGHGLSEVLTLLGAGLVSLLIFGLEFVLTKLLSKVFSTTKALVTSVRVIKVQ